MLEALRFVIGAVAKKDFVAELKHLKIKDGRIQGFNGNMSLSSPIDFDIEAMPNAAALINAVRVCDTDEISLSMTATGRLAIKAGNFKAFLNCIPKDQEDNAGVFPSPEGDEIPVNDELINAIRMLSPFMTDDASRPWANGIMIKANSAYATNNVMLAEYWHGLPFTREILIPRDAVHEILRMKERPTKIQMTENSMTVWFEGERWLRTQLLTDGFPEKIYDVLKPTLTASKTPLPEGFFDALLKLKKFTDETNQIIFTQDRLSTSNTEGDGAEIDVAGITAGPIFGIKYLMLLEGVATSVDWNAYPGPCAFFGPRMRGMMMGIQRKAVENAG